MSNQGSRAPPTRITRADDEDWEEQGSKELAAQEEKRADNVDDEDEDEDDEDQEGVMVRILPYVFIGDAYAAWNQEKLKENGITHIVNLVSDDVENRFADSITYYDVACSATIDDPIDDFFADVAKFIFEVKEAEGKVLIHCIDGLELSPAFMIAYMLIASFEKHKKLPLKDALAHVEKLKKDICPNDGFISKLIALEKKLFGAVSMKLDRNAGRKAASGPATPHYLGRGKGRKLGKKRGQLGGPRR